MRFTFLTMLLLAGTTSLAAQDPALVEAIAPILQAEDRRVLEVATFAQALEHPDLTVRRTAVVALGRIGDPDGLTLLAPRLLDREREVVADVFFAMGLIDDERAVPMIVDRLRNSDSLANTALIEATSALARIGGAAAAAVLRDVINGSGDLVESRRSVMRGTAILESWRLGAAAPVSAIVPFARDTSVSTRWYAFYALSRLGNPQIAEYALEAAREQSPLLREAAARALSRRIVDSAGMSHQTATSALLRMLGDESRGVRITALGSLAGYADSSLSVEVIGRLSDSDRNVRVAAANALGALGGSAAATALAARIADGGEEWGVRQAALLALARVDPVRYATAAAPWAASADFLERLTVVRGWASVPGGDAARYAPFLRDRDERVREAVLPSWRASVRGPSEALRQAANQAWQSGESGMRVGAIPVLADSATDEAIDLLTTAWRSSDTELRHAALSSLVRLSRGERSFLTRLTTPTRRAWLVRPDDPVLRGIAARGFPSLAARWGGVSPIETGYTLQDYREFAARFVLATENPRVEIDVDSRGRIELELLPRQAPLTVANFLRLVDRRYFDNTRWHRVVPNFVIQDGDPTETGSGGPGWSIRDEINRLRYDEMVVGMALSGPDTGGSQWFINLSPQPHLNGGYTIFGRVSGGHNVAARVLQGDRIRSITRGGTP